MLPPCFDSRRQNCAYLPPVVSAASVHLGSNLLGMGMTKVVEFVCKICNTRFFRRPEELGDGIPRCPVCAGTKHGIDAAAEPFSSGAAQGRD